MLQLNDSEIKGHELRIAVTLPLAGEDISGQSSYTGKAESGDKSKQLAVTLHIKYVDAENLTELVNLAQAKDDDGARVNYNIVNDTSKAMNIRQVQFFGDMVAREDEATRLWRVAFKLSEVTSVAEAKEANESVKPVADQKPTGQPAATTDTSTAEPLEFSSFEKGLKFLDDLLKKSGQIDHAS